MRCGVVLGEDAGSIVSGHDEDRIDGEEGERTRHGAIVCQLGRTIG